LLVRLTSGCIVDVVLAITLILAAVAAAWLILTA
jgi:hypothetical protein